MTTRTTNYLLDTHVWLWHLNDDRRQPAAFKRRIDRDPARCWLSPVSVWELTMLVKKGRFPVTVSAADFAREAFDELPLREAPFTREIAYAMSDLPSLSDPADAIIAATARVEGFTLMTVDRTLIALPGLKTLDH